MELYAKYIEEREGRLTITTDHGFLTYSIQYAGDSASTTYLFVHDMFVDANFRSTKESKQLTDKALEIAALENCAFIMTSIDPKTKTATSAMRFQLYNKMQILSVADGLIYLIRYL